MDGHSFLWVVISVWESCILCNRILIVLQGGKIDALV